MEAYSPVAHGIALRNKEIAEMANKYGVSAAQLCVRYDWQLGMIVLPKTANPEHQKENIGEKFPAIQKAKQETQNIFMDSYVLEFLNAPKIGNERDFQKSILENLKNFILPKAQARNLAILTR